MKIDFPVSIFQGVAIGLVFAVVASLIAIAYARRMGLIDAPGGEPHKIHTRPVPVAGGMALLVVLTFGWIVNQNNFGDLWKVLLPASIVFAVGILDDFQRVRFWVK
nr:hypothetical protein [Chloroflexota bacterium]